MVSNRARYISESTTDEEAGDMEYLPNNQQEKPSRKPTRTPKCFSKNALMARENRLKKKMYIGTLENQVSLLKTENRKLSHVVDNQSFMIDELKKEVKYLKSIMANSEGIGKLIHAINASTGMAVTSSLDKKLTLNKRELSNRSPIACKTVPEVYQAKPSYDTVFNSGFDFLRHPWEETSPCSPYANYPTPESTHSCYGSPDFKELSNEGLLLDLDIPIEMNNDELLNIIDEKALDSSIVPSEEHNYHNSIKTEQATPVEDEDDVGVCLHVSKNKVSLEFCPSCSDNALLSWKTS